MLFILDNGTTLDLPTDDWDANKDLAVALHLPIDDIVFDGIVDTDTVQVIRQYNYETHSWQRIGVVPL